MSDVSCVIFYAGKMLQTIEFPLVALNINLFEGPLYVIESGRSLSASPSCRPQLRFGLQSLGLA
jgi:hypothetical protein